jgi:hypothetical protein
MQDIAEEIASYIPDPVTDYLEMYDLTRDQDTVAEYLEMYDLTRDQYFQQNDAYLMDLENWFIEKHAVLGHRAVQLKKDRIDDPDWMALIRDGLDCPPNFLDACVELYKEWVQQGGGDDWFQD